MKALVLGVMVAGVLLCAGCGSDNTDSTSSTYSSEMLAKFTAMKVGDCVVALVGDSNTYLIPSDLLPDGWVNMGISGDTSVDVVSRWDLTLRLQPKVVILAIGTNDIGKSFPFHVTMANIEYCVTSAEKEGIKVYVQAVPPTSGALYKYLSTVNALNTILKARYGESFIELPEELYATDGSLRTEYTLEGLHLNDAGQKLRMDRLVAVVKL